MKISSFKYSGSEPHAHTLYSQSELHASVRQHKHIPNNYLISKVSTKYCYIFVYLYFFKSINVSRAKWPLCRAKRPPCGHFARFDTITYIKLYRLNK